MPSNPMNRPLSLQCEGRELHWDKIATLWVCDRCGVSLTYDAFSAGTELECGAQRLPGAVGIPNPKHTYLRQSG